MPVFDSPQLDLSRFSNMPRVVRPRRRARLKFLSLRLILLPLMLTGLYSLLVIVTLVVWALAGTDYEADADVLPTRPTATNHARYRLTYHYTAGGRRFSGAGQVDADAYRLIAASDPPVLRIRAIRLRRWSYDQIVAPSESPWDLAAPPLFVSLLGVLLGMLGWFFAFVLPNRSRALYEQGSAAPGHIVRKIQRVQGKTLALTISYDFSPSTGPDRTGVLGVWRANFARASEGEPVVILYDVGNPDRNVVYEYGDFELVP